MKKSLLFLSSALLLSQLHANESFNSEISHVIGGAVMAGGITAVIDSYYPEYRDERAMMGFGISSAAIIAFETVNVAINGGDVSGQLLDVAAHVAGSAVGAYVTDEFILSPVVQNSSVEGKYVGLSLTRTF